MVTTVQKPLDDYELWVIGRAIHRELTASANAFIRKCGSITKALAYLYEASYYGDVTLFYEDDRLIGLLMCKQGEDWWSTQQVLVEELVLVVDENFKGFSRLAIDELENIAKKYRLPYIIAGCAFADKPQVVTNAYLKKGFTLSLPTYVKEVNLDD